MAMQNIDSLATSVVPAFPSQSTGRLLFFCLGAPVLTGAVIALPLGAPGMLLQAVRLPAVLWGLTLLMAPALYIGLSLVGGAPPARQVLAALLEGLRVCGLVLVGLCPATAFLLATSTTVIPVLLLGPLVVAAGTVAGLRASLARLLPGLPLVRAVPVVAVWTCVSLGLGAHWFVGSLVENVL